MCQSFITHFRMPDRTNTSHTTIRTTTLLRELIRDYGNLIESTINPPYDDKADAAYVRIFSVASREECFITHKKVLPFKGDHLYAVRQYHKHTGRCGFDSQWNRINASYSDTYDYKVFRAYDSRGKLVVNKDIGYQDLTEEELNHFNEEKQSIYRKVTQWKAYLQRRMVHLSFPLPVQVNQKIKEMVQNGLGQIQQTVTSLLLASLQGSPTHEVLDTPPATPPPLPIPTRPLINRLPAFDPSQWYIQTTIRQSGKSRGQTDKYYYHTVYGTKCRSKADARRYQQSLLE